MWVYSHMSFSVWSVCAWLCAGKMPNINGLFTFVAAVGAQRSILTIPWILSAQLWFDFCVCLCSWVPSLSHNCQFCHRHKRRAHTDRITIGPRWHTDRHRQAVFPSERSAKPQATITLVPVCLPAAEMERCVLTAPWAAGGRCATAGSDAAGVWIYMLLSESHCALEQSTKETNKLSTGFWDCILIEFKWSSACCLWCWGGFSTEMLHGTVK